MNFPKLTQKRLDAIEVGETVVFADCHPTLAGCYISRRADRSADYKQRRALLVLATDETQPVMTIARIT